MATKIQPQDFQRKKTVFVVWLVVLMVGAVLLWVWQIKRYNFFLEKGSEQITSLINLKDQSIDIYKESSKNLKNIKDKLKKI